MADQLPMDHAAPDAAAVQRGYEAHDLQVRILIVLAAGFVVVSGLIGGGLWWLYRYEHHQPIAGEAPRSAVERQLPHDAPPLQPQAGHDSLDSWDLQQMHQAEDSTFKQLGWSRDDKTHRFVVPAKIVAELQSRATTQVSTQPSGGPR